MRSTASHAILQPLHGTGRRTDDWLGSSLIMYLLRLLQSSWMSIRYKFVRRIRSARCHAILAERNEGSKNGCNNAIFR